MGKRYDEYVTPQNTPRFAERRMLFLFSGGILIFNLLITIFLFPANFTKHLLWVAFVAVVVHLHYADKRREMWSLGGLVLRIAIFFIASAFLPIYYNAPWLFIGWGIELVFFILLAVKKLKGRPSKRCRK